MLTENSPEIIKLSLLETELAEVIIKYQQYIGNIWIKMLEFRASVLNLKDAIYGYNEKKTNANLHIYEVANFKFGNALQNMRNMICDGLITLQKNPEKHANSIAAYQSIKSIIAQYDK